MKGDWIADVSSHVLNQFYIYTPGNSLLLFTNKFLENVVFTDWLFFPYFSIEFSPPSLERLFQSSLWMLFHLLLSLSLPTLCIVPGLFYPVPGFLLHMLTEHFQTYVSSSYLPPELQPASPTPYWTRPSQYSPPITSSNISGNSSSTLPCSSWSTLYQWFHHHQVVLLRFAPSLPSLIPYILLINHQAIINSTFFIFCWISQVTSNE